MRKSLIGAAWLLVLAGPAPAAPAPLKQKLDANVALSLFTGQSIQALSGSLRGFLVQNLGPVLYEARPGWGRTVPVKRIEWHGQGLEIRPEKRIKDRKDGTWQHIRLTALHLADSLVLDIREPQVHPGRITFKVFIAFDARIYHLVQKWKKGLKLYDGHTQARCRVKLALDCVATCKLQPGGDILPDAVVRLRVQQAHLDYDNLVVEHVAGLGGELAELIGDAVHGGIRKWNPELEQQLRARAEAAIVKAADTKEVRVSLMKLLTK